MGDLLDCIDESLAAWIGRQKLFFVATAPLSKDGHVNLSPKGGDSFRILDKQTVAYQDYTGSGAETAAHLRENGRITIMFCAFDGPPRIVRLHGKGKLITRDHPNFKPLASRFPDNLGTRSYIWIDVTRFSKSCGFSIPTFEYLGERDALDKWAEKKGPQGIKEYQLEKNRASIDGLSAY